MENTGWVMPTHIIAGAGIVINEKDEVLLVKTHMEEAGIDIEVGEVFCISSNTGKYPGYHVVKEIPTKIMLDFICRAKGGTPRPSDENSESKYVAKAKALELIQAPAIIERYKAYLEYTGRPIYMEYITNPSFELKLKRLI